jgi:hypothetical protein
MIKILKVSVLILTLFTQVSYAGVGDGCECNATPEYCEQGNGPLFHTKITCLYTGTKVCTMQQKWPIETCN